MKNKIIINGVEYEDYDKARETINILQLSDETNRANMIDEVKEAIYNLYKFCLLGGCDDCPFKIISESNSQTSIRCVFNDYSQPFQSTNIIDILEKYDENFYN